MWIGLGFGERLSDLAGIDRVRIVDWSDHDGLLRGRSAGGERALATRAVTLVSITPRFPAMPVRVNELEDGLIADDHCDAGQRVGRDFLMD